MTERTEVPYLKAAIKDLRSGNFSAAARNIGEAGRMTSAKTVRSEADAKALTHMANAATAIRDTGIEVQQNLRRTPAAANVEDQTAKAGAENARAEIEMAIEALDQTAGLTRYLAVGAGLTALAAAALVAAVIVL